MIDSAQFPIPGHAPQRMPRTHCGLWQLGEIVGLCIPMVRTIRAATYLTQTAVVRRCGLFLCVALFCLLSQHRPVQAQSNNPPQVEPVAVQQQRPQPVRLRR